MSYGRGSGRRVVNLQLAEGSGLEMPGRAAAHPLPCARVHLILLRIVLLVFVLLLVLFYFVPHALKQRSNNQLLL